MSASASWPLPPSRQHSDWLPPAQHAELLDWALTHHAHFKPTKVTGGKLDPAKRRSVKLNDLGPHRAALETSLRGSLGDIFRGCSIRPFEPDHFEIELVAHRNGAFFSTHIDTHLGAGRAPGGGSQRIFDRMVSGVYYFHTEPKAFSGGTLRLYRLNDTKGAGDFIEYEPLQNSLVVFPSWAPHEVREVRCAQDAFQNARFAVNLWICREGRSTRA